MDIGSQEQQTHTLSQGHLQTGLPPLPLDHCEFEISDVLLLCESFTE